MNPSIQRVFCPCDKHGYPTTPELREVVKMLDELSQLSSQFDLKATSHWANSQRYSLVLILRAREETV